MDILVDSPCGSNHVVGRVVGARRRFLFLVASHPTFKDPRISWAVGAAARGDAFACVGLQSGQATSQISCRVPYPHVLEIEAWRYGQVSNDETSRRAWNADAQACALRLLLRDLASADTERIADLGIPAARAAAFADMCRYMVASAERIVDIGMGFNQADGIIAADIDSLLPALVLSRHFDVPVVYDAHEVWPESKVSFTPAEIAFWSRYEQLLATPVAARFVASAPSAAYMTEQSGLFYEALPNCEPRSSYQPAAVGAGRDSRQPVTFLFQGIISRGRGLHLLIDAWHHLRSDAQLVIRGPNGDPEYHDLLIAAAGPLLGTRILFADLVTEAELVSAATAADIGVIPYEPVNINNIGACPNKLSQYLAAGLPILTNDLPFLRHVVEEGNCGVALDFSDRGALVAAIDELAKDPARRAQLASNGVRYFLDVFHWEKQSEPFYLALDKLVPSSDDAMRADWTFTHDLPPADAWAELQVLQQRHGLQVVFPLQDAVLVGEGDTNGLIDLRRHPLASFVADPDGMSAVLLMPRVLDVTHVLLDFVPGTAPQRVTARAWNEGGQCGEGTAILDSTACVTIALSGNPTLRLQVIAHNPPQPPQLRAARCLSFGIVRDSGSVTRPVESVRSTTEAPVAQPADAPRGLIERALGRFKCLIRS